MIECGCCCEMHENIDMNENQVYNVICQYAGFVWVISHNRMEFFAFWYFVEGCVEGLRIYKNIFSVTVYGS